MVIFYAQHRLGVESFGFAMFGISMVELLLPAMLFGYNHFGSIQIARLDHNKKKIGQLKSDIVCLRLVHSIILIMALFGFTTFVDSYRPYRLLMMILSFAFIFSSFEMLWVHIAVQKLARINIFIGLGRILSLSLVLILVKNPEDAILFAGLTLGSNAVINLLSFFDSHLMHPMERPSWQRIKNIFRKSIKFACVLGLATFMDRIDVVLVERFSGITGAGIYTGPARIAHSLFQIGNAIIMAFFSEMVVLKGKSYLQEHLKLGIWALSSLMGPFIFGVWFVESDLLSFLFGKEFSEVSNLLGFMVLNTFFGLGLAAFGLQILMVKQRIDDFIFALLLGCLISAIFGVFLVKIFGLSGVAFGMCLGKASALTMTIYKAKKILGKLPGRACLYGLSPAFLMTLCLILLRPQGLVPTLLLGLTSFASFFILLNRKWFRKLYLKMKQN